DLTQNHIIQHFKNTTKTRPFKIKESEEWTLIYKPIKRIKKSWYNISNIEPNELLTNITGSPQRKAPGGTFHTYELYKLLGPIARSSLLKLMNTILSTSRIPNFW